MIKISCLKKVLFGALSQGNQTTAGSDVINFINSLKDSKSDISTFSLMQQYLISGLKNRIPPEIGISGIDSTIQTDEFLRKHLNKSIDTDKVFKLLNGRMTEIELNELTTKIENAKSEWDIYALEYGKAISICMANYFGENINSDNFMPCQSSTKKISPNTAARHAFSITPRWRSSTSDNVRKSGLIPERFIEGETIDD